MPLPCPAPTSIKTVCPAWVSSSAPTGSIATRYSSDLISLGTPTIMRTHSHRAGRPSRRRLFFTSSIQAANLDFRPKHSIRVRFNYQADATPAPLVQKPLQQKTGPKSSSRTSRWWQCFASGCLRAARKSCQQLAAPDGVHQRTPTDRSPAPHARNFRRILPKRTRARAGDHQIAKTTRK